MTIRYGYTVYLLGYRQSLNVGTSIFFFKFHIGTVITSIKKLLNDQSSHTSVILFYKISYGPFRNQLSYILTVNRGTM